MMVAIDLGSNTIRCIEFNGAVWGKSFERIVRTAESLYETKRIGDQALNRIIASLYDARKDIDFETQKIVAYTTAAMRIAENSDEVLETIRKNSGVSFEIIDAEKEAMLTLQAVVYRLEHLKLVNNEFVLVDIGGGSTELTHYRNGIQKSISLNIGIVTLSEGSSNEAILRQNISLFQERIGEEFSHLSEITLVLSAGTPTTMAAYVLGMDYEHYDADRVNGFRLKSSDCIRVYNELLEMDEKERIRFVGVGREELILAGILMVQALYDFFDCSEAIVIDDGLREGIALEYFRTV